MSKSAVIIDNVRHQLLDAIDHLKRSTRPVIVKFEKRVMKEDGKESVWWHEPAGYVRSPSSEDIYGAPDKRVKRGFGGPPIIGTKSWPALDPLCKLADRLHAYRAELAKTQ